MVVAIWLLASFMSFYLSEYVIAHVVFLTTLLLLYFEDLGVATVGMIILLISIKFHPPLSAYSLIFLSIIAVFLPEQIEVKPPRSKEATWVKILFLIESNDGKLFWKEDVQLNKSQGDEVDSLGEGRLGLEKEYVKFIPEDTDGVEFLRFSSVKELTDRIELLSGLKKWTVFVQRNKMFLARLLDVYPTRHWRPLIEAITIMKEEEGVATSEEVRLILTELELIRGRFKEAVNILSVVETESLKSYLESGGVIGTELFPGVAAVVLMQRGYVEEAAKMFSILKSSKTPFKFRQKLINWIKENYDFK